MEEEREAGQETLMNRNRIENTGDHNVIATGVHVDGDFIVNKTSTQAEVSSRAPKRVLRKCKAPPLDDKFVQIHPEEYAKLKGLLLSAASPSVSLKTAAIASVHKWKRVGNVGVGGHGGIGKTWTALFLVHDEEIKSAFGGRILWSTFGEDKVAFNSFEKLWYDLGGADLKDVSFDMDNALAMFLEVIKKDTPPTLLVLDDIWHDRHLKFFKQLQQERPSIRLLITTRFQGKVAKAFGKDKSAVVGLSARLNETEALKLMSTYVKFEEGQSFADDTDSMKRIATAFGYHPLALSVISTQAPERGSWAALAVTVKENPPSAREDAGKYVVDAVDAVFDFQKQSHPKLKKQFCVLGVFREDTRFSVQDVAYALQSSVSDATRTLVSLSRSSLIDQRHERLSDFDAVYSLHDLLRDYARKHGRTKKTERKFVRSMCNSVKIDVSKVTPYVFENLEGHLRRKRLSWQYLHFRWFLKPTINVIINSAATGYVSERFHENWYIIAIAFAARPSVVDEMQPKLQELHLSNPDFFGTAFSRGISVDL